ncbi:MAG: hypothetical protein AAF676_15745 [Pseudomonadota bacterium]
MAIIRGFPKRADVLVGTTDKDRLKGKGGDDVLIGRGGDDRLLGEGDDDTLFADRGKDRLVGGDGADRFHILDGRGRADVIRDFDPSEDVLDLSGIGARRRGQLDFSLEEDGTIVVAFGPHQTRVQGDVTIAELRRAIDFADRLKVEFEALELDRDQLTDLVRLDDDRSFRGFDWDGFGLVNAPRANRIDDSGHAATSGRTAVFFGPDEASISADAPFDFHAVSVSGVWRDGMEVRVVGLIGGVRVGRDKIVLGEAGEVQVARLNDGVFGAVDEVRFSILDTGTTNARTDFDAAQVSLDDLIFFT